MVLELDEEDRAVLVQLLREAVTRERIFPLSPPVLKRGQDILARLESKGVSVNVC